MNSRFLYPIAKSPIGYLKDISDLLCLDFSVSPQNVLTLSFPSKPVLLVIFSTSVNCNSFLPVAQVSNFTVNVDSSLLLSFNILSK